MREAGGRGRRGKATRGHVHLGGGRSFGRDKVTSFDGLVGSIEGQASSNSVGGYFHFVGRGGGGATQINPAETRSAVRGGFTINVRVKR